MSDQALDTAAVREDRRRGGATAAIGPFFHARPAKADKGELVVVSWGGSWAKSLREVMFTPFEKETGYKVRDDGPPEAAKLKAMVQSGSVTLGRPRHRPARHPDHGEGRAARPDGLRQARQGEAQQIPKTLQSSHAVGHKIYSFNIVYNTKTFPTGKHPRSWAEVWDGEKFKGGRSFNFRGGIAPQLEIALLADGVPMDKLYPIDVERAWKSMDRLRPLVTKWYQSHAEAIQLLTAGEADIACTIGPRGIYAKRSGAPVDVDYNQGKLGSDYWCLVKGSKNQEVALQFINFALDGKRQAGMVKENPYGPSNADRLRVPHAGGGAGADHRRPRTSSASSGSARTGGARSAPTARTRTRSRRSVSPPGC